MDANPTFQPRIEMILFSVEFTRVVAPMVKVLVVAVLLVVLANGTYAAVAPRRWIRSRWSLSGTLTEADTESLWMRLQIRIMGLIFTLGAVAFSAAVVNLSIADLLFGALAVLMFGSVLIGSAALFISPERNLSYVFRRHLPESSGARQFRLLLVRLFALSLFIAVTVIVVRGLRQAQPHGIP